MPKLSRSFYAGVFLLSIGMLAAQFLLTRILSLVFWYHFVFLIISVVMFGLTAGTLLIYFFPKRFTQIKTIPYIVQYAALSGLAVFFTFLSLFYFPAILNDLWSLKVKAIVNVYFPILVIPFVFMGMAFSLILTRFPQSIGKIYGINLLGSAGGCLAAYFILNTFNGASAILVLSAIFLLAAACFTHESQAVNKALRRFLLVIAGILLIGALINQKIDAIQYTWYKDRFTGKTILQKWNFFSHVALAKPSFKPFGWGYSPKVWETEVKSKELMIVIDEGAGTVLTLFDRLEDLDYLNMDISSLVYHIRPPKSALIIGAGGGRDLMAAVINGAEKVVGVEINNDVIDIAYNKVKNPVLSFPQVQIHNDDGRSFVARSREQYDVIQASLVDSFAAASSGAFALSENSLYTKEAWVSYLQHLTPTGVLTFSRWYHKHPLEMYRVLTLAKSALREIGITDYRKHILIARVNAGGGKWPDVGTILVSRTAFTDEEIQKLYQVSAQMEFEVALTKDHSIDPVLEQILALPGDSYQIPSVNGNINPPVDNRPFYFYFSDFRHFFKKIAETETEGPRVLKNVTLLIVIFGVVFLLIPFLITPQSRGFEKTQFPAVLYFSSIGLAFMFIEIPLIQRLGIFLGHPVYGLTVVLFGLLLSCGLGSMYSKKIKSPGEFKGVIKTLLGLIILMAFLLPTVLHSTMAAPVFFKIVIALLSVGVIGFLMGIPFPFGVSMVSQNPKAPLIFYWAVNGFTSMCASAFATVILIHLGYPWAVMIGFVFYLAAFAAAQKLTRS
jgi:hypothetical protein